MSILYSYLSLGYTHVLPLGFDHVLFILTLFFASNSWRTIALQCTIFTAAHSLALGISLRGYLMPNSQLIEVLIASSIVYSAVENIVGSSTKISRNLVVFFFGLLHGLGFAQALMQIGLPKHQFFTALLSFNLGVESGQLSVILVAYLLIFKWFGNKPGYQQYVVYPISSGIACIALYWTVERILLL